MADVFISLGSNIGDREKYIAEAIKHIKKDSDIELIDGSSLYETEPVGYRKQDHFLNIVIKILTQLLPVNLLNRLKRIENILGKNIKEKWGPRTIDIDILYYDDIIIQEKELTIPHPLINERMFVLIPLAEIVGNLSCPKTHMCVTEIMKKCKNTDSVVKVKSWREIISLYL